MITKLKAGILLLGLEMDEVPIVKVSFTKSAFSNNLNLKNISTKGLRRYKAQKGIMDKVKALCNVIIEHELGILLIDRDTSVSGLVTIDPKGKSYNLAINTRQVLETRSIESGMLCDLIKDD